MNGYSGLIQKILKITLVLLIIPIIMVMVYLILPLFSYPFSDSSAIETLEGRGYFVASADEYDTLNAKLDALKIAADAAVTNAQSAVVAAQNAVVAAQVAAGNASVAVIAAQVAASNAADAVVAAQTAAAKVDLFNSAPVYLFPGNTSTTVTLECGDTVDGLAGTWGPWREVKDSGNVTLSSKFQSYPGYISDIPLFFSSAPSNVYIIELAYGGSYTTLGRIAFNSSTTNYSGTIAQIKSRRVPAGQTIYYRAMCESDDGATLRVGFRYFYE